MEDVTLSKRVKALRAKNGLSQEQLAEESGLSLRTIQRIENGETMPRGDTVKRLAAALKVSPDEIIDWQMMEDKGVITLMNLSQFGYLAFPLLGIIIPLAIWSLKKDKVKDVNALGKAIVNFQISWAIILFLSYGLIMAGLFLELGFRLSPFSLLIVLGFLYGYNAFIIIVNTIKIQHGNRVRYKPAFPFLH